jgi:voltage-gated potassium channel
MAQALLKPHVHQFINFTTQAAGLNVGIEQVRVSTRCSFAERTLAEMHGQRELGVIVLAIRKAEGEMLFNPPAESKIEAGDHLIVMGEADRLQKLEQLLAGAA